jgi:RNA polymerase sigma factor (sigma-70 family)
LENVQHILTDTIQKAKNGNSEALASLYAQYCKAMYNICVRMIGNRVDAEDVLQEAFIIAFKNLHQLKEAMQFGGWLRRIVVNECIRHSKKQFYFNDWDDTEHELKTNDADTDWFTSVDMNLVHQQIKALPDGCRQVFNLYVIENYGHKEIANCLGISESTSKSQYHRARQLLKERITKEMTIYG